MLCESELKFYTDGPKRLMLVSKIKIKPFGSSCSSVDDGLYRLGNFFPRFAHIHLRANQASQTNIEMCWHSINRRWVS